MRLNTLHLLALAEVDGALITALRNFAMPIINRRFYANPAYGRALAIARIAEQLGQNVLLGGTNAAHKTGENVIEGVPSLDIKSLLRASTEQDSDHPSGICELEPRFWVEGPECEEGKDYHATAFMRLAGPAFSLKKSTHAA